MRFIVVGLGIQGNKRKAFAGDDLFATVDPLVEGADYACVEDVPLDQFDAALVCTGDQVKIPILTYLLSHGKHILVEKPLFAGKDDELKELQSLADQNNVCCYTAYNHRFEPHIITLKKLIDSGELGKVYNVSFFYGNGTARDVRNSEWRDKDLGVITDLGSHLFDLTLFLFEPEKTDVSIYATNCFENRAYDHARFGIEGDIHFDYEVSLLSWRNHFRAEVVAEKGSVFIECLCKWGPSRLIQRDRKLPSGRPDEKEEVLIIPDPTWKAEYEAFKSYCDAKTSNIHNDVIINRMFNGMRESLNLL